MDPEIEPDRPAAPTSYRAATILASIALIVLVASVTLFMLPVDNPGVQSCGSPALFLVRATSDAPLYNDSGAPIHGWDQSRLARAAAHPCSKRVADRAVPAGIALVTFWMIGLIGLIVGFAARRRLRRRLDDDHATV